MKNRTICRHYVQLLRVLMGLRVDIASRFEEGWHAIAHNVPFDDAANSPRINFGLTHNGSSADWGRHVTAAVWFVNTSDDAVIQPRSNMSTETL